MIDYSLIDRSINYYANLGFKRIESPWTVTKAVSSITKPENKNNFEIVGKDKVLVASGEQSFLYLYLKNFLPLGKYQTVTPCFRDETFDLTHTKYFIKNELIITDNVDDQNLNSMIAVCRNFYEQELKKNTWIKKTNDGYDIEVEGIEVGSYGIRKCDYLTWIYGTGCPEPRISFLKKKFR